MVQADGGTGEVGRREGQGAGRGVVEEAGGVCRENVLEEAGGGSEKIEAEVEGALSGGVGKEFSGQGEDLSEVGVWDKGLVFEAGG